MQVPGRAVWLCRMLTCLALFMRFRSVQCHRASRVDLFATRHPCGDSFKSTCMHVMCDVFVAARDLARMIRVRVGKHGETIEPHRLMHALLNEAECTPASLACMVSVTVCAWFRTVVKKEWKCETG